MKTLAFAALFMGATGLLACGGGGGDDDGPVFPPDGGGGPVACNPVTQQGCAAGEKCAWIIAQTTPTFLGQTACVRDGNVDLGGACTDQCIPKGSTDIGDACSETNLPDSTANPPIIGTDDCAAGGVCINSVCTQVCQGQDSCGAEMACVNYGDLFTDNEGVGACSASCDPLVQDCGEGKGCYVDPFPGAGYATCEAELNPDRQQNAACPEGDCSLNGCAAGFGPWLQNAEGEVQCTRISGSVENYLVDPDGEGWSDAPASPDPAPGSNPFGAPAAASCEGAAVQDTGGLHSYFLQAFYGNTTDTPAEWSICAPFGIENGDCTHWSVEHIFAVFNTGEEAGAGMGMTELQEMCDTTDLCGFSCVSNAKFDELAGVYCADPDGPGAGSPACADGARSKISAVRQAVLSKGGLPTGVQPRFSRKHNW